MREGCIVGATVDLIAKRWSMLILLELHRAGGSPKRFNGMKRELGGITPKVLAARLRELEEAGLVRRAGGSGRQPRAEYSLTDSGEDLMSVIVDFKEWAVKWRGGGEVCAGLDCSKCGL
jgi:DNA-binding HxlR family transcriptional regulator